MNCLFDTARVVIRVTVNILYFVPEWLVSGVVGMLWNIYRAKTSTLIKNGLHQLLNKDSAHFVSTVSNETILDNEIMVSFDVESLFTNVPIDAAVQAALQKLEEQAITTLSYDPRIWKRYVDNTFTILDRENVDDFLQHLNNQQPSTNFIMKTEKDKKLALLDTAVLREPDGHLITSITGSLRTPINT